MLNVIVPEVEMFDEKKNQFITTRETKLQLEHSLLSISKWEAKWHKPFLSKEDKTNEETIDYIKCMTITPNVDDGVFKALPNSVIKQIVDYIEDPMTATWFNDKDKKGGSREVITSELVYYWMISQNIPFTCEKWHLNRLLTLVRICMVKNSKDSKKMSKKDIMSRNKALNEARKAKLNSHG